MQEIGSGHRTSTRAGAPLKAKAIRQVAAALDSIGITALRRGARCVRRLLPPTFAVQFDRWLSSFPMPPTSRSTYGGRVRT